MPTLKRCFGSTLRALDVTTANFSFFHVEEVKLVLALPIMDTGLLSFSAQNFFKKNKPSPLG